MAVAVAWAASVLALALAPPPASAHAAHAARPAHAARVSPDAWRIGVTAHYGPAGNASGFAAVVASGPAEAWAFGGTNPGGPSAPVALRWDGRSWQRVPLPPGLDDFISVASAPTSKDIWAASYYGGYLLHWDGARWTVARRWSSQGALTGVTAVSPLDVWVFGTSPAGGPGLGTWHLEHGRWLAVTGPDAGIYRASAVNWRDIWAIGGTARGSFVEHFDGRAWARVRTVPELAGARLHDVLAVSARSVWVAGNLPARRGVGPLVVAHWNGSWWRAFILPVHVGAGRLASDGHGGAWITATTGGQRIGAMFLHLYWSGGHAWTTVDHGLGNGVSDIALVPGTDSLWASGGFLTHSGGDAVIFARGGT
ncbi:MAG TPA: hypothetical protein DEH11_16525 [Actinobacteria bacterium]|jgi:hypothetical protein|nr:hypothetical protein [Actinomycetota bacterium]